MSRATHPGLPATGQPAKIASYRLDRYIGQGGTAAVYLAQDERRHRPVALKVLAPELARDAAFRTRMIRESRAAAALDHPHVIPVYDADEESGILYVAMRYVHGGDARSLLNQLGPLPPGCAWRIIAQIGSALDAVHARGLIHGDVRPANILLDATDEADGSAPRQPGDHELDHSYLADFGMSKVFSPDQIIATGQVTDTLDYAAPEQIEGRALDGRTDLYSLACTGFELLCGAPPFGQDQGLTLMYAQLYAPPPAAAARRADLPAAVDLVLATALAKNRADRYPSCGRFAEELRAALGLKPDEQAGPPASLPQGGTGNARPSGPAAGDQSAVVGRPAATVKQAAATLEHQRVATEEQSGARELPALAVKDQSPAPMDQPAAANGRPAAAPGPLVPAATEEPGARGPEPSARRPRARLPILAIAVVVVGAAAVASGLALSQRSAPARPAASTHAPSTHAPSTHAAPSPSAASSPPASALASGQAAALSSLLTSSAAARTALHDAVDQVGACTNLPGAVSQLQAVVNQRAGQYGRASALTTSALPDGTRVKSALMAAMGSSLKADQDYLAWARQQLTGGCTPTGQSSAYNAAYNASQQADVAKEAFVRVWNPVAARYGIKPDSPRNI